MINKHNRENAATDPKNKENTVTEMSVVWPEYRYVQMNHQPRKCEHIKPQTKPRERKPDTFYHCTSVLNQQQSGKCHINTKNHEEQEILDKIQKDKKGNIPKR